MQINRFDPDVFILNRFTRINHFYTMQINRFEPVVFMLNLFESLKHL